MFKKATAFLSTLALASYVQAQVVLTNTPDQVNTDLNGLADNAISLFDKVVPVILAVVGLSILIAFVKKIRKS